MATSSWQEKQLKKSFLFKKQKISKIFLPLDSNKWKKTKKNKSLFGNNKSQKNFIYF